MDLKNVFASENVWITLYELHRNTVIYVNHNISSDSPQIDVVVKTH